jgi:DNA-directed RNA polymerase subunit F
LCAIAVPLPIAMRSWSQENAKTKKIIERVLNQSNDRITEDELFAISEATVEYIVYSSHTDPKNAEQVVEQLGDQSPKRRMAACS